MALWAKRGVCLSLYMATFKLPFSLARWRNMKDNDDPTYFDFIDEVFNKTEAASNEIRSALLQNHFGAGFPTVEQFKLTSVDFDNHYCVTGKVDVDYLLNLFFGCDDMNTQHNRSENIKFRLDPDTQQITFTIPEIIGRDTFEEF